MQVIQFNIYAKPRSQQHTKTTVCNITWYYYCKCTQWICAKENIHTRTQAKHCLMLEDTHTHICTGCMCYAVSLLVWFIYIENTFLHIYSKGNIMYEWELNRREENQVFFLYICCSAIFVTYTINIYMAFIYNIMLYRTYQTTNNNNNNKNLVREYFFFAILTWSA